MKRILCLILCLILLGLTIRVKRKSFATAEPKKMAYLLTLIVSVGYFLVVAKTALLNAEEAIRYEMPIYGLLIILVVTGVGKLLEDFSTDKNKGELL